MPTVCQWQHRRQLVHLRCHQWRQSWHYDTSRVSGTRTYSYCWTPCHTVYAFLHLVYKISTVHYISKRQHMFNVHEPSIVDIYGLYKMRNTKTDLLSCWNFRHLRWKFHHHDGISVSLDGVQFPNCFEILQNDWTTETDVPISPKTPQIANFMGPIWGPSVADRTSFRHNIIAYLLRTMLAVYTCCIYRYSSGIIHWYWTKRRIYRKSHA